jgi:hypothetical protein
MIFFYGGTVICKNTRRQAQPPVPNLPKIT